MSDLQKMIKQEALTEFRGAVERGNGGNSISFTQCHNNAKERIYNRCRYEPDNEELQEKVEEAKHFYIDKLKLIVKLREQFRLITNNNSSEFRLLREILQLIRIQYHTDKEHPKVYDEKFEDALDNVLKNFHQYSSELLISQIGYLIESAPDRDVLEYFMQLASGEV